MPAQGGRDNKDKARFRGHDTQDLIRDCFGTLCLAMTSSAILALFNCDDSRDLTTERLCCWGHLSRCGRVQQPWQRHVQKP